MTFLIIAIVAIGFLLAKGWIKFVYWVLPAPRPKANTKNPYINAHLMRTGNDAAYNEYLEWLGKNGEELPIKKLKTKEELRLNGN
ncbi:hypothetical protein [Sinomicrobium soli]|uniref:hypothetical protein n=1 Tax=Sinomicrobium sp. N-1-3-6 TaxID=2219864 RepID=UPI000DCBA762|nr:hypothetical protein [Sinomicrobium sp. N-1-3-6]RAV27491.1 hypothetical protein DN748_18420 [Sinomicrobium sp. N-1-3-6]